MSGLDDFRAGRRGWGLGIGLRHRAEQANIEIAHERFKRRPVARRERPMRQHREAVDLLDREQFDREAKAGGHRVAHQPLGIGVERDLGDLFGDALPLLCGRYLLHRGRTIERDADVGGLLRRAAEQGRCRSTASTRQHDVAQVNSSHHARVGANLRVNGGQHSPVLRKFKREVVDGECGLWQGSQLSFQVDQTRHVAHRFVVGCVEYWQPIGQHHRQPTIVVTIGQFGIVDVDFAHMHEQFQYPVGRGRFS